MAAEEIIRIGIICGGQSSEHEISLRSAQRVAKTLNDHHEVLVIYIDSQGAWWLAKIENFLTGTMSKGKVKHILTAGPLVISRAKKKQPYLTDLSTGSLLTTLDVLFPVLHGPRGEDGTIQGLLELSNIPYVGSGVLGSAITMDKDITKRLLTSAGIVTARHVILRQLPSLSEATKLCARMGLPLFVKPANQGSSVGITKVTKIEDLPAAVSYALSYDTKILIEEFILGRELEVSVLGNDQRVASVAGEIIVNAQHEFYSYSAKYVDKKGARQLIPAPLSDDQHRLIKELACQACNVLEIHGMARVDFFLKTLSDVDDQSALFVNEVNTIPGFTEISMYAKLWEASGVPFMDLLQRLIDLSLERHKNTNISFDLF